MISWKKNDPREKTILEAINMLNIYAENFKNHEGNFLSPIKPVIINKEVKQPIGERPLKSFKVKISDRSKVQ